jgi:hypothetical protein
MAVLLGRTSAGTTADFNGSGHAAVWSFVATVSGQLVVLKGQTKVANATGVVTMGIYDDVAGSPTNLLGKATAVGATGTGVFTATLATPVTIVAGTTYWLGWRNSAENFDFQGDTVVGAYKENSGTVDFPNPFGGSAAGDRTAIIWGESLDDAPGPASSRPVFLSWQNQFRGPLTRVAGALPTVSGVATVTVASLGSASDFGAVTPIAGPVTISIAGLVSAGAFGIPTTRMIVAVTSLGSAGAFGAVTATPGSVTRAMSSLASAASFSSVSPVAGNVNVPVSGLASAAAFGAPSAGGGTTVTVSSLNSAAAFGAVTPVAGPTTRVVSSLGSAAAFGGVTPQGGNGPTFSPAAHGGKNY